MMPNVRRVSAGFRAKRLSCLAAVLAMAFFVTPACRKQNAPTRLLSVRIGYLEIAAQLPLYVAVEQGFFEEEGLAVQLIPIASSNDLVNAATANRVDVLAGAAVNAVVDGGEVSGKRHKLIAVNFYSDQPTHITDHLLVKKTSEISTVPELVGKRVASFPGSVKVLVNIALEKYGLPRSRYTTVEMPPKDWEPALASGAIDAVVALEPTATQIIADSVGRSILPGVYAKIMPALPLSGTWISDAYATSDNKKAVEGITRAYSRAIEYCNANPDRAKAYLVRYAKVRADIVGRVNLNPWSMVNATNKKVIEEYARLLASENAARSASIRQYFLPSLDGSAN